MANSKIGIIITREFNERVRKKSFIVTTILMPVLMIGLMVAPALIMRYSQGETRHISVIDESGVIAPRLESSEEVVYEPTDLTLDEARREHTDRFGILWIGGDIMTNPGNVKLYTNGSSAMLVEESVSGQIADIIEKEKLKDYNIENLSQILDEVKTTVYAGLPQRPDAGRRQRQAGQFVGRIDRRGAGARYDPLHVPDDLRRDGHAVGHRGEEQPGARSGRLFDQPLPADAGQDPGYRFRRGGAGAHLGRAGVRRGCARHAAPDPCRDDGKCRGDACRDARSDGGGRRYGDGADARHGDRFRICLPDFRLSAALRDRWLPALFGDVRCRRFGCR
jgi:hypothetical protein